MRSLAFLALLSAPAIAQPWLGPAMLQDAASTVPPVIPTPQFVTGQFAFAQTFSGTTVAASLSGVTAGDAILVTVEIQPNSGTISASTGTSCTAGPTSSTAEGSQLQLFVCGNSSGGAVTVTATSSVTITSGSISLEEWKTVAPAPYDQGAATGVGQSAVTNTGNFTTTTNADMIWCAYGSLQGVAPTLNGGWTANSVNPSSSGFYSAFQTQATAGAINPGAWTTGASSFNNIVGCMGIKHS